ncbi:outer membrane protein [Aureimonas jatrophae]|uniref:Outer membrane insertion C-terminal signal n=1 Tax=Aureimonas jatrophae TaxID=1166073 RepID=A0A1H0CJ96_9HYPH|nr:outer membrane beta-barrel protein [Aureimonas jatrophae]MBB3949258.1 opacity protein-like surface antigen [Aureimonas jatrophae]SDN57957.1 outer membrane insertion C-terminal signal [Aureimonas jatrophae]
MTLRSLLTVSVAVLIPVVGHAADVDLLASAPEVELAETRSGFYLRGDVFYDVSSDLDGTRAIAQGNALATGPLRGELEEGASFGLGLGYRFTDMLRADLTVGYGERDVATNAFAVPGCGSICLARDAGSAHSWNVLASAYLDLGTVAGFTPYVGAGLGAVRIDYDDIALTTCGLTGCQAIDAEGERDWRFAYALDAGVAYDLTEALTLDLGYRYLDTEGGQAWSVRSSGGAMVAVSDDGPDQHALRIGLRYRFQ